jgi:hypothetical protein
MKTETSLTQPIHGLMAEFDTPEALLDAATRVRDAGYTQTDAYAPFPVHGLAHSLGAPRTKLPLLVLAGGAVGGFTGYFMQYFATVIHWDVNVGGRPLHSWPAYIPVTFEMTVLFASLTAFLCIIVLNGLPQPYHPVFNVAAFERASSDRFFLCVEASDPNFDREKTRHFLESLEPRAVTVVEP